MQKKVIIAIIVLILVFLSYKFILKVKSDIASSIKKRKNAKELEDLVNSHTSDVGGSQINNVETFESAEYSLMADTLYSAMDGMGTSEGSIFAVLSLLKTKADWIALVSAYGSRKSSSWGSSFEGSLTAWLSDELGGSDKIRINNILGKFNVQI